jgi:hypothetical protein
MWLPPLLALLGLGWRRTRSGQPPGPPRRKPAPPRPGVEALEDRSVPSFLAPVSYPLAANGVAVGDFNNDGIPDLAATASNTVRVLLGNGDGTFQSAVTSTGIDNATLFSFVVGDFNRDGKLDVAALTLTSVSTLLGRGDGTFQPLSPFTVSNMQVMTSLALGDFNGDGSPDLVAVGYSETAQGGNKEQVPRIKITTYVDILPANGDGSFGAGRAVNGAGHVSVGDFNRDGKLDVLMDSPGVSLALGNGDGTLKKPIAVATAISGLVTVGDFNSDGRLDFVVTGSATVSAYLGNGDGSFLAPRSASSAVSVSNIAVGDFNRDGKLDLVATDLPSGTVSVLLGNGDGSFQAAQTFAAGSSLGGLAVADFNGDGWIDLAVSNYDAVAQSHSVLVLLNDRIW